MILYGESIIPFSDDGGSNFGDRLGELGFLDERFSARVSQVCAGVSFA